MTSSRGKANQPMPRSPEERNGVRIFRKPSQRFPSWGPDSTGDKGPGAKAASDLQDHLAAGGGLPNLGTVPGLLMGPGEVLHADVTCGTARLYETAVHYPEGRVGYYDNQPVFGGRWVDNPVLAARRRREAEVEAQLRWRNHDINRVVLTSVGLRVLYDDEWIAFDHELLIDLRRESESGHLVLVYRPCPPLSLTGSATPWFHIAISHIMDGNAPIPDQVSPGFGTRSL